MYIYVRVCVSVMHKDFLNKTALMLSAHNPKVYTAVFIYYNCFPTLYRPVKSDAYISVFTHLPAEAALYCPVKSYVYIMYTELEYLFTCLPAEAALYCPIKSNVYITVYRVFIYPFARGGSPLLPH
jgi:hypothetical protein